MGQTDAWQFRVENIDLQTENVTPKQVNWPSCEKQEGLILSQQLSVDDCYYVRV